ASRRGAPARAQRARSRAADAFSRAKFILNLLCRSCSLSRSIVQSRTDNSGAPLRPTLRGLAFVVVLGVCAAAHAAGPVVLSTHCREIEVPLDSNHSAARLGDCGDPSAADL